MSESYRYQYDTSPKKIKPEYEVRREKTKKKTGIKTSQANKKLRNKRIIETKKKAKVIIYVLATFSIIFTIL